jgi:3-mercaptopyruvate sulfurtransferase SseA
MKGKTGSGLFPPGKHGGGPRAALLGRYRLPVLGLLIGVLLAFFLQSCGGYSTNTVDSKFVPSDITPQTLNEWIQDGFVDNEGFPVVILDVTGSGTYNEGHIPGSLLVTEGHSETRSDGVLDVVTMVLDGPSMNALIQRLGITSKYTTIVITGSSMFSISRFYYDFRYWGFPQSRLKVFRGTRALWTDAGLAFTTETPPTPTPSSFSVADIDKDTAVRASLQEMINVAEGNVADTFIWDVRRPSEYDGTAGSTSGPDPAVPGFVAFEGHIKGAVNLNVLNTDPASGPVFLEPGFGKFVDNATMLAGLGTIGVTGDKTTYVY